MSANGANVKINTTPLFEKYLSTNQKIMQNMNQSNKHKSVYVMIYVPYSLITNDMVYVLKYVLDCVLRILVFHYQLTQDKITHKCSRKHIQTQSLTHTYLH